MIDVSAEQVESFQEHGAVYLPGLFREWIDTITTAIETNMAHPGIYASENLQPGETGRFFDDYCNWERIPELETLMRKSPAPAAAASLMRSQERVQFFHDHVLVKEPGTMKPTPWHQDSPYYFLDGDQTVSFWIPIDPVENATLRLIAGSHKWEKPVLPVKWLNPIEFYANNGVNSMDFMPVPDPDAENVLVDKELDGKERKGEQQQQQHQHQQEEERKKEHGKYKILEWSMQSGDAVAFHYKTVHGARGNTDLPGRRRRALSLRYIGEDVVFACRPGKTSPPFPGHNMCPGDRLREDWFPIVWRKPDSIGV